MLEEEEYFFMNIDVKNDTILFICLFKIMNIR